jgi:hypothetical protein
MRRVSRLIPVALAFTTGAGAPDAVDHVAAGDRLHAAGNARGARRESGLPIAANPLNYDAPCKASRRTVHPGTAEPAWTVGACRLVDCGMMRTSPGTRLLPEVNSNVAPRYLERAVAAGSSRIGRHLDLGLVLRNRGILDGARAQLDWIARAAAADSNDLQYMPQAATERRTL